MGILNKLFGGDAGIKEAMYETYSKLKVIHPYFEEYEILALVLQHRFKTLNPDVGLLIAVLAPRIDILTQWVVGLERCGGPRYLDSYLAKTTTLEERERALNYIRKKTLGKSSSMFKSRQTNIKVSEDIVDKSAEVFFEKFNDKLNSKYSEEDSKPLAYLSDELKNTVANIYYRFFKLCNENPTDYENIEKEIEETKSFVEFQIHSWESQFKAIIALTLTSFPNTIVAEYAAINHALELSEMMYKEMPMGLFQLADDILIAVFKYKINVNDAFSKTGASTVAECKMREDESDEIPNLMHYFEYSWGYHFENPY